jgi:hypothetical protein
VIVLGILFLLGLMAVGTAFALAAVFCLLKRRYVAAALLFLPTLCSLALVLRPVVSTARAVLAEASSVASTEANGFVSTQDLVGSWGRGREAVTFHEDGTARAADGTLWRWRQSHRNAFVMSSAGADRVPDRCWLALRQDDEVLLMPVDGCFDESRGWTPGEALRRNE